MNDYKNTEMPSSTDWHNSRLMESGLFLLIIFIEAAIFFYLIHGRLIVGGHDGFQYFSLQYGFLNHVVNYGDIPPSMVAFHDAWLHGHAGIYNSQWNFPEYIIFIRKFIQGRKLSAAFLRRNLF
jgi:hypothetical protein